MFKTKHGRVFTGWKPVPRKKTVSLQWGEAARLVEKQRTAGSGQRTEKEGKSL